MGRGPLMNRDGPSGVPRMFCHKQNIFVRKNLNHEISKCTMKVNLLKSFQALFY